MTSKYLKVLKLPSIGLGMAFPSPYEPHEKEKLVRFNYYKIFTDYVGVIIFFLGLYNLYRQQSMKELIQAFVLIGLAGQVDARNLICVYKRKEIDIFTARLDRLLKIFDEDPVFEDIFYEILKYPLKIVKITTYQPFLFVFLFYAVQIYKCIVDPLSVDIPLFKYWPFEYNTSPTKTRLTMIATLYCSSLICKDFVIQNAKLMFIGLQTVQLTYLKRLLIELVESNRNYDGEDVLLPQQTIKWWAAHYHEAFHLCEDLSKIISPLLFVSYVGILYTICLLGVVLSNDEYLALPEKINGTCVTGGFLIQMGILCWAVEKLERSNESIVDVLYYPPLIFSPPWFRQSFSLLYESSSRMIKFTAMGFFTPTLQRFGEMLQLIVSISLALIEIDNEL